MLDPREPSTFQGYSLQNLHKELRQEGCMGCKLGLQDGLIGPVLFRGNENSRWMILGEAPGKDEDRTGSPFTGPAGKLLDKMIAYMDLPEEMMPYIGNVIKCRPIAPQGTHKENVRPYEIDLDAISTCIHYLAYEIARRSELHLIVLAGDTAFTAFFPDVKKKSFTSIMGRIFLNVEKYPGVVFYPIYHPAFLIRKKNDLEAYKPYQQRTQACLDELKQIIIDIYQEDEKERTLEDNAPSS